MIFLFSWVLFRFHVKFQGYIPGEVNFQDDVPNFPFGGMIVPERRLPQKMKTTHC